MSVENGHPFKCVPCGKCYTTARFAAKCCKAFCVDLRDAESFIMYFESREAEYQRQADAQWAEESKAYRFECSCGERFKEISHAVSCRKCRTYTTAGYCTKVTDIETGLVIYQRGA